MRSLTLQKLKKEHFYTARRNVSQSSCYEKQYEDPSKNRTIIAFKYTALRNKPKEIKASPPPHPTPHTLCKDKERNNSTSHGPGASPVLWSTSTITGRVEAERLRNQDYPYLYKQFKDSLGYMTPYLKWKNNKNKPRDLTLLNMESRVLDLILPSI